MKALLCAKLTISVKQYSTALKVSSFSIFLFGRGTLDIDGKLLIPITGLAEVDRSFVTADYSSLGLRDHAA